MKQTYLQDQRGIAMVVELLLVAIVLSLVGVAVYQSSAHKNPTASKTAAPTAASAVGLAASAATIGESESAADANIATSADASADQLKDSDIDITNLGGSTGANSF